MISEGGVSTENIYGENTDVWASPRFRNLYYNTIMKFKIVSILLLIFAPILFYGCECYSEVNSVSQDIVQVSSFYNGKQIVFREEDGKKVIDLFDDLISSAREMPAYGVALHNETTQQIQNGIWLEFGYDNCKVHNGLYYNKLLLKLEEDIYGFNLIRYYNNKYEGRCFYFDLDDSVQINELCDLIDSLYFDLLFPLKISLKNFLQMFLKILFYKSF